MDHVQKNAVRHPRDPSDGTACTVQGPAWQPGRTRQTPQAQDTNWTPGFCESTHDHRPVSPEVSVLERKRPEPKQRAPPPVVAGLRPSHTTRPQVSGTVRIRAPGSPTTLLPPHSRLRIRVPRHSHGLPPAATCSRRVRGSTTQSAAAVNDQETAMPNSPHHASAGCHWSACCARKRQG